MKFSIRNMCTPASIYFLLAMIGIVYMFITKFQVYSTLGSLFFVMVWTWFLSYLCSKGFSFISWILLLLPFIGVGFFVMKKASLSNIYSK
jgi:hypothetical protein